MFHPYWPLLDLIQYFYSTTEDIPEMRYVGISVAKYVAANMVAHDRLYLNKMMVVYIT